MPTLRSSILTKSASGPNVIMAREATANTPLPRSSQPKRAPRRKQTPLRTTLLAQISSKKELGSSEADISAQTRGFFSSSKAVASRSASPAVAKEKQMLATRNRANIANDEPYGTPSVFATPYAAYTPASAGDESQFDAFAQAFPPQQDFAPQHQQAHDVSFSDASMLSNTSSATSYSSNPSHGTVIRYSKDPCNTPPYKALSAENRRLARRVDSLETGVSPSLPSLSTLTIIHTRAKSR